MITADYQSEISKLIGSTVSTQVSAPLIECIEGKGWVNINGTDKCVFCAPNTYNDESTTSPSGGCKPLKTCGLGQKVKDTNLLQGNVRFRDNVCVECDDLSYSDTDDYATQCKPSPTCDKGKEWKTLNKTHPTVCKDCDSNTFSDTNDYQLCKPRTPCQPGSKVISVGNKTQNDVCSICPSGSFSNQTSSPSCTPCQNGYLSLIHI